MGRIIFLAPFPKDQISGGIKTTYYHAQFLRENGVESWVHSPAGAPQWIRGVFVDPLIMGEIALTQDDILVFPEVIRGGIEEMLKMSLPCRKVIFCQNQYIFYNMGFTMQEFHNFGVTDIITVSEFAKAGIQSVMGLPDYIAFHIIPPPCNERLFFPSSDKELRILVAGQKWEENLGYMGLIQRIFLQKYPDLAHIPWASLEKMDERQAAEEMRRSAIFLFLARLEALGLTGLEAMASGCAVAGFYGGGGRDYMTDQNGYWHSPEDLFGLVDSLAHMVRSFLSVEEQIWQMIAEGRKMAAYYAIPAVIQPCLSVYKRLLSSR